jgi:o-succinylbenzoate---CoA ligase
MIYFDFSKGIYPISENPYFQKVIAFVEKWEAGIESIKIQTSGSTGIPKTIDVKRVQMVASAKLTAQYFDLNEGNHAFCCLNVDFIGGMMMLVRAIEFKLQMTVIEPVSNPFLNVHSVKKIDFLALVPLQMEAILANENSRYYLEEKSALKNIIVGGAAINTAVLDEILRLKIPVYATYGMTETVSHIALKRLNGNKKSDIFESLSDIQIKIDHRNCLAINAECTNNEWIQTNDIVELRSKTSFKLLGRADRVVNSGGIKLYLDTLEKDLEKEVFDYFDRPFRYFLFGKTDVKLGEKLCIIIEAENPKIAVNPSNIFKNSILSKYKIPKEVFFLTKFVETQSGKIDYKNTVLKLNL